MSQQHETALPELWFWIWWDDGRLVVKQDQSRSTHRTGDDKQPALVFLPEQVPSLVERLKEVLLNGAELFKEHSLDNLILANKLRSAATELTPPASEPALEKPEKKKGGA